MVSDSMHIHTRCRRSSGLNRSHCLRSRRQVRVRRDLELGPVSRLPPPSTLLARSAACVE